MLRALERKSLSSEPRSRSIASLTVALVVKGPGVKRSLAELVGYTCILIAIAIIPIAEVDRRLWNHGHCLGRRRVDFLPTKVRRLEGNVLDRIRRNLTRILLQNYKVC